MSFRRFSRNRRWRFSEAGTFPSLLPLNYIPQSNREVVHSIPDIVSDIFSRISAFVDSQIFAVICCLKLFFAVSDTFNCFYRRTIVLYNHTANISRFTENLEVEKFTKKHDKICSIRYSKVGHALRYDKPAHEPPLTFASRLPLIFFDDTFVIIITVPFRLFAESLGIHQPSRSRITRIPIFRQPCRWESSLIISSSAA